MRKLTYMTTAFALLVLAVAGTALAGAGAAAENNGTAGTVASALQTTKHSSTLPFTGTNLGIFLAIALGLGLVGFTLRRSGREQE